MSDRNVSRRDFLLRVGVAGAAGTVLAACGGRSPDRPADQTPAAGAPTPGVAGPDDGIVAAQCPGYNDLSQDQLAVRRTLNYVDVTPQQGQYCNNCRFLVEGPEYGECIGCQLFAGPVAPRGWCSSWAALS
jgi:hypothetical protein